MHNNNSKHPRWPMVVIIAGIMLTIGWVAVLGWLSLRLIDLL
jgi:hypothetical protein